MMHPTPDATARAVVGFTKFCEQLHARIIFSENEELTKYWLGIARLLVAQSATVRVTHDVRAGVRLVVEDRRWG